MTQAKGLHRWQFSMVESRVSDNGIFKETMKKYLPRLFADKEQVQVFRTSLKNASKAQPARSK